MLFEYSLLAENWRNQFGEDFSLTLDQKTELREIEKLDKYFNLVGKQEILEPESDNRVIRYRSTMNGPDASEKSLEDREIRETLEVLEEWQHW